MAIYGDLMRTAAIVRLLLAGQALPGLMGWDSLPLALNSNGMAPASFRTIWV